MVTGTFDGTIRVWDEETGKCMDVLEAIEEKISQEKIFKMNFSDAILSEDLARLLWHNGAKISDEDYEKYVKPSRKVYKKEIDDKTPE